MKILGSGPAADALVIHHLAGELPEPVSEVHRFTDALFFPGVPD